MSVPRLDKLLAEFVGGPLDGGALEVNGASTIVMPTIRLTGDEFFSEVRGQWRWIPIYQYQTYTRRDDGKYEYAGWKSQIPDGVKIRNAKTLELVT